jgi:hypothetical protein
MITMTNERPLWRKSTYSNGSSNCIETASGPGTLTVRDSKDQAGPRLAIPATSWRIFTRTLKTR